MSLTMDTSAAYQRGFELRCEGRYPEARVELQKVLAVDPTHADARWQIGLIQGFEGDFDGSIETLRLVVVAIFLGGAIYVVVTIRLIHTIIRALSE